MSSASAQATIVIDRIMQDLRKSIARRELGRMIIEQLDLDIEASALDILFLVEGKPELDEVTVGTVAERLGVDPSRASRLVADAVSRGVLKRVASQADARRICLELTDKGADYARRFRTHKLKLFAEALGGWSEADLVQFSALFERFSQWVSEARTRNLSGPGN
ncbi:hypothetical protein GCM10007989_35840 [Devosia pacifica]|uniref:HTH marR-type domain-containing protein n=2 Tax=Devosia pacifica TaxID=1335967 RepID=A0A918VWS4_9HYPH|nr:hypothetical protein GCM10007989_35840 [Devosia pacifica]